MFLLLKGGVMRNFFVTSRDEIYSKTALAVIN